MTDKPVNIVIDCSPIGAEETKIVPFTDEEMKQLKIDQELLAEKLAAPDPDEEYRNRIAAAKDLDELKSILLERL